MRLAPHRLREGSGNPLGLCVCPRLAATINCHRGNEQSDIQAEKTVVFDHLDLYHTPPDFGERQC